MPNARRFQNFSAEKLEQMLNDAEADMRDISDELAARKLENNIRWKEVKARANSAVNDADRTEWARKIVEDWDGSEYPRFSACGDRIVIGIPVDGAADECDVMEINDCIVTRYAIIKKNIKTGVFYDDLDE